MTKERTKFNWKLLITLINEHEVVPVIGDDLSIIELTREEVEQSDKMKEIVISEMSDENKARVNLYDYLAVKLAGEFNIELDTGKMCLNDVAMKILDLPNWAEDAIYKSIRRLYSEIRGDPIFLDPFKKLAGISDFKTYITVNFDDFFEKAFSKEKININQPHNFSIPPREESRERENNYMFPTLFNILGSIQERFFALTDENFLEYIYLLKEKGEDENIFKELFNAIEGKSFLLIGCSFPNWLMRFFIRIISNEPFADRKRSKIVADNKTPKDLELLSFLEYYKINVIDISETEFSNAIDFVNQLFDEWVKQGGHKRSERLYEEEVFLSYSSDDRNFVELIKEEFDRQGVKNFYDQIGLKPGDRYDPLIKEKIIKGCHYFIPFISRNSISDTKRYVNKNEWRWADARRIMTEEKETSSFIKPYIIDDTPESDPDIPYGFNKLTIGKIENTPEAIKNTVTKFIADNHLTRRKE